MPRGSCLSLRALPLNRTLLAASLLLALGACTEKGVDVDSGAGTAQLIPPAAHTPPLAKRAAQNAPAAAGAEDGEWRMAAKDYANTRFSGLDQINASNASQLKLAWSFSTGSQRGHEAAPIVVGSTMYLITPFPHTVYALDITPTGASTRTGGSSSTRWTTRPWRWMRRAGASSGAPGWATSTRARR